MIEPERRKIGYARVSTEDQELTLQRQALEKYGVKPEHVYEEKASGGTMNRPVWKRIMGFMRKGDTVVIWKLDRLGRTLTGVLKTLEEMKEQGVELVSITDSWDTTTPMGDAMFKIALVFAELERKLIAERTKAGIAAKRAEMGQAWGRKSPIDTSEARSAAMHMYMGLPEDERITANQLLPWINLLDRKAPRIKSAETLRRWVRVNKDLFETLTEDEDDEDELATD